VEQLVGAITKMRDDWVFYTQCKENLRTAKADLCWEKEKEKLKEAYQAILT